MGLEKLPGVRSGWRLIEIDVGNDRSADEQRGLIGVVTDEIDADGQSLDHLDEIACRVLGRQQGQSRSGALGEPRYPALEDALVAVNVDDEIGRLPDAQVAQLRFLEVGVDPDFRERANRHQALADLDEIARIDIAAGDGPVDLRDDVGVTKIQLGLREIAPGGFEFRLGLLDGRRMGRQLSERAVDVAQFFELLEHRFRTLVEQVYDAELGGALNEVRLRLEDGRKGLVEIGRRLCEIAAMLRLRRQPQRGAHLIDGGQSLGDSPGGPVLRPPCRWSYTSRDTSALTTSFFARSNSTCANVTAALALSTSAIRWRSSATWLSTPSTARCRLQRWLHACASIARAAAVAACRSALAVSTSACFSETAIRKGSLSNCARRSPLRTRLLSSTRMREICPATRGATNVTCPFT